MKSRNHFSLFSFLASIFMVLSMNTKFMLAMIPVTDSDPRPSISDKTNISSLPGLDLFTKQVNNGNSWQITGLFVENVFALPVVQQPKGHPEFVNSIDGLVTQFGLATSFGSLGFLAHNTLSGKLFSYLNSGNAVIIVFGDGHFERYLVTGVRQFQALSPNSPQSNFVDLQTGDTLSAEDLFYETYGIQGNLILQTCISNNGVDSWGRLFVIASPQPMESSLSFSYPISIDQTNTLNSSSSTQLAVSEPIILRISGMINRLYKE